MMEEYAALKYPPHELVGLIAGFCEIQDPSHYPLLCIVLSNPSTYCNAKKRAAEYIDDIKDNLWRCRLRGLYSGRQDSARPI